MNNRFQSILHCAWEIVNAREHQRAARTDRDRFNWFLGEMDWLAELHGWMESA